MPDLGERRKRADGHHWETYVRCGTCKNTRWVSVSKGTRGKDPSNVECIKCSSVRAGKKSAALYNRRADYW